MSDPVIRRVRRSIDEAKNRGGMQAGMAKVTIDASDATRLCLLAEHLLTEESLHQQPEQGDDGGGEYAAYLEGMNSHLKAENEALRWRACVDGECRLATDKPAGKVWLLRKQAEAIEAMIENLPWYQNRVFMKLNDAEDYAQRLRQQADEAERAGGEQ